MTSLAHRMHLDEDGVTFASPLDGKRRQLTPESVVAIQEALGSDIAMVLDQCVPPAPGAESAVQEAMERSLRCRPAGRPGSDVRGGGPAVRAAVR